MRNMMVCLVIGFFAVAAATAQDAAIGDGSKNTGLVSSNGGGSSIAVDTVTFESLALPPGSISSVGDGLPFTVEGFTFTPGPNNTSGLNDSHYSNAATFWGYNGTHVSAYHDDVVITKADGGAFDFTSFDFAGFPTNMEVAFTVVGSNGASVTFTPDGICDGQGGAVDFETFALPGTFKALTSVTVTHAGAGTLQGIFSLDNLVFGGKTCTGNETIKKVKCKKGKLKVKTAGGTAGDTVTGITGGACGSQTKTATIKANGTATLKFTGCASGAGTVTVRWECGESQTATYNCP